VHPLVIRSGTFDTYGVATIHSALDFLFSYAHVPPGERALLQHRSNKFWVQSVAMQHRMNFKKNMRRWDQWWQSCDIGMQQLEAFLNGWMMGMLIDCCIMHHRHAAAWEVSECIMNMLTGMAELSFGHNLRAKRKVWLCVCVCTFLSLAFSVNICVYVRACVRVYVCSLIWLNSCLWASCVCVDWVVGVYAQTCASIYRHIHLYLYVYVYLYFCM